MKSLFVEQPIKFKELDFCSSTLSLRRKVFTADCFLFCQLAPARDSQWEDPCQGKCLLRPSFLLWDGKRLHQYSIALLLKMIRWSNNTSATMHTGRKEVIFFCNLHFLYINKLNCCTFWGHKFLFIYLFITLAQQSLMNALFFCVDTLHTLQLCVN